MSVSIGNGVSTGNVVTAETNSLTGIYIQVIWTGSQAQYDSIAVKVDTTLYVIV